ncbi:MULTISPECIES: 1-acyl-sn-glycerol-3-phosphate acyltransferase [unclassified Oceanobacter]|jgi:1-acyl-sn-glycerol-3-phosphate acyltransferase|uniref:lysophospholipid acyltransferase family protein n=1 Tax=unclassified Oceanobacter TaxID=2620260 RepID=UPI0026E43351|nr:MULTISPECIES: lysophospholipid acyltransferase family protein [unclassified Oceanobacter]MDO6680852.1 lysophospholipid acyltransferase family protein [Oceanobacter sp. 5_MG-2023]MDP2504621.1 lysophospholipid acyltransferase family protein [Oceanobacter sp. 3_MG-2023]MDP2607748.1 lysophospholipid acyltransferase family protein [Oceanobacter sp. 1_MG-2023]MDP2611068.1 lysophospholipid acyltransferase family protein [Oceanobacter sp. 2_MG-2023]
MMNSSSYSAAADVPNSPFSHKLRSILFYIWLTVVTVIWFIPSLLIGPFLPLKARNYWVMGIHCRLVIFGLRWIAGIRCEVEGRENIPSDGRGYVLISKHQSTWETFMLPTLIYPHVQVVKKELSYLPFFGWGLQLIQPIFINRNKKTNALKQVIQQGEVRLKAGIHVLVFPEGSRIPSGKRKLFSKGGAMLATKTAAPVITIAHNSSEHWPNTHWVKSPGVIRMVISAPIETAGMSTADLNELTETWINEQVDRISDLPFQGEYVEAVTSGKRF